MIAPPDCRSLNEYLLCFELPKLVLQSAEALQLAVEELIGSLAREGILYAEIRFAPQLHTVRGLTQEDAVRAALCGQEAGLKKNAKISSQLILCCMRGRGDEENEETLRITEKYLGHGVCAADLAGAEALYPTVRYQLLPGPLPKESPLLSMRARPEGLRKSWKRCPSGQNVLAMG